ncbi:MAG: MarR family transcriptional regulator, partial [Hyphomicrobiaceae bacterium]|nr:MarR family transcriptional regulator [Hyphomicrobiaceae bacterium]
MPRPKRNDDFILKIARMRYEDRMAQNEIARELNLAESTISRALKDAFDLGFIEIRVAPHALRNAELERQIIAKLDLKMAIVIDELPSPADTLRRLGGAVARVIEQRLSAGDVVGVSDGATLAMVAAEATRGRSTDIDVVSLIGGIGRPEEESHSSEVCRTFSAAVGGRAWQLPAPAIVDDAHVANTLKGMSTIKPVFDLMDRLTWAVFGVGAMGTGSSTVVRAGVITGGDIEQAVGVGAVGTICARFYDARGIPVPSDLDARTLAISLDGLRRTRNRIAVASGLDKIAPLVAARRGDIFNGIGTDSRTAKELMAA